MSLGLNSLPLLIVLTATSSPVDRFVPRFVMPNWPRPSSRPSEYYVKCERLVQTSAEATATRARNTPAVQRGQERRSRNRRVVSQRAGAGQRLARQARSRTVCPTGSPAVPSCGALPGGQVGQGEGTSAKMQTPSWHRTASFPPALHPLSHHSHGRGAAQAYHISLQRAACTAGGAPRHTRRVARKGDA